MKTLNLKEQTIKRKLNISFSSNSKKMQWNNFRRYEY
jgi:hypothetical protein